MIERINSYAARRFGVGTTAGSFVRIHVWALVFLVVLSLALPSQEVILANQFTRYVSSRALTLGTNDPRGFARSPFGKGRFRIAWITGSEGRYEHKNYQPFLASLVARPLRGINGRRIAVDVYLLDAMRIADIYFALLDAMESKPDMIVLSLNPLLALNPLATHQWKNLDSGAALQLLSKPPSWPLAAMLLSPADLAWGVADKAFRPLKDRNYYSDRIHRIVDDFGPLDRAGLPAASAAQKPTQYQRVLSGPTVNFWYQYRLHEPLAHRSPRQWAQWFDASNQGKSELNKIILRAIARELRDSKIPSFVYDAPVSGHLLRTSKALDAAVGGIERQLEDLRGSFTAPNILYQPVTATRLVPSLQFFDIMHLARAGAMGPYLAGELCRLVAQVGYRSNCRLPSRTHRPGVELERAERGKGSPGA
jgi:hypothetical protein